MKFCQNYAHLFTGFGWEEWHGGQDTTHIVQCFPTFFTPRNRLKFKNKTRAILNPLLNPFKHKKMLHKVLKHMIIKLFKPSFYKFLRLFKNLISQGLILRISFFSLKTYFLFVIFFYECICNKLFQNPQYSYLLLLFTKSLHGKVRDRERDI